MEFSLKTRIRINRRESTASCAVLLPSGFLVGMAAGTMVSYVPKLWGYVQQLLRESNMGERTNA
jgi:hypothetical protein